MGGRDIQESFVTFAGKLTRRVFTRCLCLAAAAVVAAVFAPGRRYRVARAQDEASPTPESTECFPFWSEEGLAVTPAPGGGTPEAGGEIPVGRGQPLPRNFVGYWFGRFSPGDDPQQWPNSFELTLESGGPGENVGCAYYGADQIEGIPATCRSNFIMEELAELQPLTVRLREQVVEGPCVDGSTFKLIVDGDIMFLEREGPGVAICRAKADLGRQSPVSAMTCPLS